MTRCLAVAMTFAVFTVAFWLSARPVSAADEVQLASAEAPASDAFPSLGFTSQLIPGYGLVVTEVEFGSRAFRLGLSKNDVILTANGQRLAGPHAWSDALDEALCDGGQLALTIRDGRSGKICHRQTTLKVY